MKKITAKFWAKEFGIGRSAFFDKIKNGQIVKLSDGSYEATDSFCISPVGKRARKIDYIMVPDSPIFNSTDDNDGCTGCNDDNGQSVAVLWGNNATGLTFRDRFVMGIMDTVYRVHPRDLEVHGQDVPEQIRLSVASVARLMTGNGKWSSLTAPKQMIADFAEKLNTLVKNGMVIALEKNGKKTNLTMPCDSVVIDGDDVLIKRMDICRHVASVDIPVGMLDYRYNTADAIVTKAYIAYRRVKASKIEKKRGEANKTISQQTMIDDTECEMSRNWLNGYLYDLHRRGLIEGFAISANGTISFPKVDFDEVKKVVKKVKKEEIDIDEINRSLNNMDGLVAGIVASLSGAETELEAEVAEVAEEVKEEEAEEAEAEAEAEEVAEEEEVKETETESEEEVAETEKEEKEEEIVEVTVPEVTASPDYGVDFARQLRELVLPAQQAQQQQLSSVLARWRSVRQTA